MSTVWTVDKYRNKMQEVPRDKALAADDKFLPRPTGLVYPDTCYVSQTRRRHIFTTKAAALSFMVARAREYRDHSAAMLKMAERRLAECLKMQDGEK